MKKKLLVYLHGYGFDKSNNADFVQKTAEKIGTDVLSLNGPFKSTVSRGGYAWYTLLPSNPSSIPIIDEKIDIAASSVKKEVETYLEQNNLSWDDVILMGRSQGAVLAMYLALSGNVFPGKVIAIVPSYPEELFAKGIKNKSTQIMWVDAKHDARRTPVKENDCKRLVLAGCSITHLMDENSDHDNLSDSMIDLICAKI